MEERERQQEASASATVINQPIAPASPPPTHTNRSQQQPNFLQRLGNAFNAAKQIVNIRPDWSQLTANNIRDSLVGMLDAAVGSAVDIGCMAAAAVACNLLGIQERGQHVVSDLILSAGGTVNTKSDAYGYGRIASPSQANCHSLSRHNREPFAAQSLPALVHD